MLTALQSCILARLAVSPARWGEIASACPEGTLGAELRAVMADMRDRRMIAPGDGTRWSRVWRLTLAGSLARTQVEACS